MPNRLDIRKDNNPQAIFDWHFTIKCPSCNTPSNVSAVSVPRWEYVVRFRPTAIGIVYRCDSCNAPVFIRFRNVQYSSDNQGEYAYWPTSFEEVVKANETYDYIYLPSEVSKDFREALICYSNSCFNAFAAMCRRTIQSACTALGAEGKDKVLKQVDDLKNMTIVNEETFIILKEIVIAGHDGAHPHLPSLSSERAEILLELMKDVLYELFVRRKKIEEAATRRLQAIKQKTA